ncbi:galactose mutarotase-like protein [Dunaliella salina]|uniref:glucose-6-phosphate 1-epimerase n=1 Tax=Dunaliella salina TaxID=3046 RepID=A0ABQ7GXA7_DUNSA|nr:galactose mutarotase-like protein [Dunaliella salina]|eukprot:KAF5839237.1 galactose mutarotase-like protein [Dunaliella salina]
MRGRGGTPVCFPQFGMLGPLPTQHGFARNRGFSLEHKTDSSCTMSLTYDGQGAAGSFPHPFTLHVTTSVEGATITQELKVSNTGSNPLPFTAALHTYYRVADISQARVEGLKGVSYRDNLQQLKEEHEQQDTIRVEGEVDRIYVNAPSSIKLVDEAGKRQLSIEKNGFPDAVLWNPWIAKAKGMADFGDEEYKEMVCIEPAMAISGPVNLDPGATWVAKQSTTASQL